MLVIIGTLFVLGGCYSWWLNLSGEGGSVMRDEHLRPSRVKERNHFGSLTLWSLVGLVPGLD